MNLGSGAMKLADLRVSSAMSKPDTFGAPLSRSARAGLLPDWPAGGLRTELVATHNRSAATVTQAGGWNGLPAFSSFVQAPVPSWRPWTRVWNSEASRGERGGHDRLEPVGGMEAWGTWY